VTQAVLFTETDFVLGSLWEVVGGLNKGERFVYRLTKSDPADLRYSKHSRYRLELVEFVAPMQPWRERGQHMYVEGDWFGTRGKRVLA
jgi:hypothetical protein